MFTISRRLAPLALLVAAAACTVDSSDLATAEEQDVKALERCGGFAALACPGSKVCVDDPADACEPSEGGADCGGVCVDLAKAKRCGGFAGLVCAEPTVCVDLPTDGCVPGEGGADCPGVCLAAPAPAPTATCETVKCSSGTHCELDVNSLPVCVANADAESY